jgi:hypothetical protein
MTRGISQSVFRRQKRETEDAAREAERRALFEELAKRPDTVCPFLGLAQARAEYHPGVTDEHRCYAFGDPAELSAEQQQKVCLQRGYGNCPRYLRGVLVIPTEELEALRRPQPPSAAPPVRPALAPEPAPAGRGGGRRGLVIVGLLLLLIAGGGGAAFMLLGPGLTAFETPTPAPSVTVSGTVEPSPEPTSTAVQPSPTPEPTPGPDDTFSHYEVAVAPGQLYTLFEVDDATGAVLSRRPAEFDNFSQARVERLERVDGSGLHWRTIDRSSDYVGLSYIHDPSGPDDSGDFRIRAVYLTPDGERRVLPLPEDEL